MLEMVSALRTVGGDAAAAHARWNYDPVIDRIVATWPPRFATARGQGLGMRADGDFEGIVRAYVQDQAQARA